MSDRARIFGWGFWVRRGVVALVLGVVTTVGVAWGLAAWVPLESGDIVARGLFFPQRHPQEINGHVHVTRVSMPGAVRRDWRYAEHFSLGHTIFPRSYLSGEAGYPESHATGSSGLGAWGNLPRVSLTGERSERLKIRGTEDARGWPWLALWCAIDDRGGDPLNRNSLAKRITTEGGLELPARSSRVTAMSYRVLPYRPMWRGLVADVGFYTLAAFVLLTGIPVARLRMRRGFCPRCGYELEGCLESGCPECGWGRQRGELQ